MLRYSVVRLNRLNINLTKFLIFLRIGDKFSDKLKSMKNTILFCACLAFFAHSEAHAALGASAASIETDRVSTRTAHALVHETTYTRHELTNQKLKLHEFSKNETGKVFAVAWQGSTHPDFKTVFGDYYPEFEAAYASAKKSHHHGGVIIADSENLHFEVGGRMTSVYGKVWIKSNLPTGMDCHEIQ
jgi:hypothetical protein